MASPQKENGHTQIANEIIERLVASGLNGTELAVVFFVIRKTYGFNKKEDEISLSQFLNAIPVSRQTLCSALKNLQLVKILRLVKKGTSLNSSNRWAFNKDYDTWQLVKKSRLVKKSLHQLVKFSRHTKDNIQKTYNNTPSVSDETNDDVSSNELEYVSDLEEYKKLKRATAPKELPPFSLKAERDKLLNSSRRINHIVGLYLEVLGNTFPANSHIQFRTLLKRHYADAKHLVDFTDGQIKDAMAKCEKDSDMGNKWKWTLGTVLKYISK